MVPCNKRSFQVTSRVGFVKEGFSNDNVAVMIAVKDTYYLIRATLRRGIIDGSGIKKQFIKHT